MVDVGWIVGDGEIVLDGLTTTDITMIVEFPPLSGVISKEPMTYLR